MEEFLALGIDCGGTHTDAALLLVNEKTASARLLADAKTITLHDNLPVSISNVLQELALNEGDKASLSRIKRITLGATLAINAIVQNREDEVGLAVTAGPGLDPSHFTLGRHVCIVPGGLDHRGIEVSRLYLDELEKDAHQWAQSEVKAVACVGKFSPRNPGHETAMANIIKKVCSLPITQGHKLSGALNFPRRIATAYYNASIMRLHNNFLDAVEQSFAKMGISGQLRLLKADGGAIPFAVSRNQPVTSLLSGPAASVMGMQALNMTGESCTLLLDIGGTTTDISLAVQNSPVMDRNGMKIKMRRTLIKSLASISIGIGGDSALHLQKNTEGGSVMKVGPERIGPAMAFGGSTPTLLDALNVLAKGDNSLDSGNQSASLEGIKRFVKTGESPEEIAWLAVHSAVNEIVKAAYDLVEEINSKPIYTLSGLRNIREARPVKACLAGGPASIIAPYLEKALGMPIKIAAYPHIANAIGAALTIPTASLEIYVNGATKILSAPAIGYKENIPARFSLEDAKKKAMDILKNYLQSIGIMDTRVEIVEADLFAVLDDYGRGSNDMRVTAQARPGICAILEQS